MVPALPLPSVLYRNEDVNRYLSGSAVGYRDDVVPRSPSLPDHRYAFNAGDINAVTAAPVSNVLYQTPEAAPPVPVGYSHGSYLDYRAQYMVDREPLSSTTPVQNSSRVKSTIRNINAGELSGALRNKETQVQSLTETVLSLTEEKADFQAQLVRAKEMTLSAEADRDLAEANANRMQAELETHSKKWLTQAEEWEKITEKTMENHRKEVEMVHHSLSEACSTIQSLNSEMLSVRNASDKYKQKYEDSDKQVRNLTNIVEVQQKKLVDMAEEIHHRQLEQRKAAARADLIESNTVALQLRSSPPLGPDQRNIAPARPVRVMSPSAHSDSVSHSSIPALRAKVMELERKKSMLKRQHAEVVGSTHYY
eukprot:TRINITY_DN9380_c0_g1_i1.p1 TRINITY_DN9380_c0_g1~~TRINITY_DN9380_c0_g1_i1.p1  ORF type:complete len:366 (+),score=88.46 TRINITY_DN9380_c0_g1_i1:35-1132(+)